ncbi:tetratricopeptide repeat protein [Flavobacterium alkalisoli]|uniref:tetratricopeptide repeat protein n=1 Tax=Flavobacterium alkalisoli TaxID=2602769 RepID=UPI003A9294B4
MKNFLLPLYLFIHLSILLIIIIHEMGHAMFAVLFSNKEATIYLGSHGNQKKSLNFKIGLFNFYIKKNIFKWSGGLCRNGGEMNFYQSAIYLLAGPLLPLLTGMLLLFISRKYNSEYFYGFSFVFTGMSFLSLVQNLYPKKNGISLKSGAIIPNDGYSLVRLFRYKKRYPEYVKAINLFNEKKYSEAVLIFKDLIDKGLNDDNIIKVAIGSALISKNYKIAEQIINEYGDSIEPDANHYINMGYFYSIMENHDKAMEYYSKSLKLNKSWHAYNNIGYHLNLSGNYTEALGYFDKAIAINPHAYPFNNRGLAKIKLGNIEEGLSDLEHGHTLDPANSYYYKNKGIYYYDLNEYSKALEHFKKAKEMDTDTYKIDFDIEQAEQQLAKLNI